MLAVSNARVEARKRCSGDFAETFSIAWGNVLLLFMKKSQWNSGQYARDKCKPGQAFNSQPLPTVSDDRPISIAAA
jgi:hypothetical protein